MNEVVIAGYLRTAQTRSRPRDPGRDWFHKIRSDELLAKLLPELIKRVGIEAGEIDDFLVGTALGVSEQWSYGGRTPIFLANLPDAIPAKCLDQQCGSAMAGLHMGYMEIATGNADIVMLGGMEHMTRVPNSGPTYEQGMISLNESMFTAPEYEHWDMTVTMNMGLTASAGGHRSALDRRAGPHSGRKERPVRLRQRLRGRRPGRGHHYRARGLRLLSGNA